MFFLFLSFFAICSEIQTFDIESFRKYRDSLPKNTLFITLQVNKEQGNDEAFELYNKTIQVIDEYLPYTNKSFGILVNPEFPKHKRVNFIVYIPGSIEEEVFTYLSTTEYHWAYKLIKNAKSIIVNVRRLEKARKHPEIARLKAELREIKKLLRSKDTAKEKHDELSEEYDKIASQLIELIPKNKKELKALKIQLAKLPQKGKRKREAEYREMKQKEENKTDLTPEKIERLKEKEFVDQLKHAYLALSKKITKNVITSAFNFITDSISKRMKKSHDEEL